MTAGPYDITVQRGEDYSVVMTVSNPDGSHLNLTGYTADLKVLKNFETTDSPLLEMTTGNSQIVLGGSAGTITLSLAHSVTAGLTFDSAVYFLTLTSGGGLVTRLLQGDFKVK